MKVVKIPGIKEVAECLGLTVTTTERSLVSRDEIRHKGLTVSIKKENGGWNCYKAVSVVIETNRYPVTRRKVFLYNNDQGNINYITDKVEPRLLTDKESAKIKAKYAEMQAVV